MKNVFVLFLFSGLLIFDSCKNNSVTPEENSPSGSMISALNVNKQILVYSVSSSADGLSYLFHKNNYDDAKKKNFITYFIENFRFFDNMSGYFYCYDTNFICVAHPVLKNYIGGNHIEDVDSRGIKFVYIMRDSLRNRGKGFIEHSWLNQTTGLHELKVAYINLIKGTNLFFGSGVFVDYQKGWNLDSVGMKREIIRNIVHVTAKGFSSVFKYVILDSLSRVQFMKDYLDSVRFFDDKSGYYFVDDINHNNIVFPTQKNMEGQSLYNYIDPKGNYPVRNMVNVINADGRGFVEYYFLNPTNNKTEKKFVYVEKIEGTDYFIGTGVYF